MDVLHRRLAKRIRARALVRGVALTHLADRAPVARSSLFRVLKGAQSPTVAWVAKIARVLRVETWELLR